MRRWNHDDEGFVSRAARTLGVVALASAGLLLWSHIGSLRRYLNLRRMSAPRHPQPPGTQAGGIETPPRWGTTHWPLH